jgi:YesN/AraC family two-component response regulator
MKIVIADDSSMLRARIKSLLEDAGKNFSVYEAENGVDALRSIREYEPDLAIIDIRMPEMNGIEVLEKLRELKLKTTICILTNYPFWQYRKRCYDLGAHYFLDKNQEVEMIKEIIIKLSEINKN